MPVALPNELVERILQALVRDGKPDRKTVRACALVCHAWVSPAQRVLFTRTSVNERNCAPFIAHTASNPSGVVGYVKILTVFLWGNLRVAKFRMAATADKSPLLDELLPHLHSFVNLEQLILDGCRGFSESKWKEAWTRPLAAGLPSLKTLGILDIKFKDLSHFVDLVSSLLQVSTLSVDGIDIANASHEGQNEDQKPYRGKAVPPPTLTSFTYSSGDMTAGGGPFLSWLATSAQTCKTLRLTLDAEAGDVNAGVNLIQATGPSLENLFLSFSDQWHLWEGFTLSANTGLKTLILRSVGDFGCELVPILSSIKSPLRELTLGGVEELQEGEWDELVSLLISPSFSSLAQVNLRVGGGTMTLKQVTDDFFQKHLELAGEDRSIVFDFKRATQTWY